ncbi:uncharacterized protein PRCAT00001913001 [Priceomyces carsonii]|uniref:uncharacterized protein n=1 Tax=Priceomyces carsonii TaxID=28549 RepID=UPI002EDA9962|nr:unnamed protein product [Priceomyces carsonii]
MSAILLGSTGLVGNQILAHLLESDHYKHVTTVSRREPSINSDKIEAIVEKDSSKWGDIIESTEGDAYFSAFGTTRAAAGSAKKFVEIDQGINVECAKAAKKAGVKTFVLISSMGANPDSFFLYFKTKGRIEKEVLDLKFPRTIILRPGLLLGQRETSKGLLVSLMVKFGELTHGNMFAFPTYPIYGKELGKIAVDLASKATSNSSPDVQIYEGKELTEMAKKL